MYIIVALLIVVGLAIALIFNRLVRNNYLVKESWSGIQVQLTRRHDLIPNLVETVKGYRSHEQQVFTQVTEARASCLNAENVAEKAAAENTLSKALKSLFAVAEAYPELKASQNFIELHKSLAEVEEQLQSARRYYNATVRDFNILINSFPSLFVAKFFNYREQPFFEVEAGIDTSAPKVTL